MRNAPESSGGKAAADVSMNNRRSYLDAMNAGRRRRPGTSLEQLSNTLDELESRIRHPREERGSPRHARLP
jgi:localization factor PodJL